MKNVLLIGFVWPESTTTAAGGRILQLIHFFKAQHYTVTFASTAAKTQFSDNLTSLGVTEKQIKLNDASFNDFCKELAAEIVVFDRFLTEEQFGWRVTQQLPNALKILDTEDLHFLRKARENAFKNSGAFSSEINFKELEITKREIASIYRCDFSLIISSYEMQLLQTTFNIPKNLLLNLPFMLDSIDVNTVSNWTPFSDRKNFICIGNGKHKPNVDAVLWLYTKIWPLIRKELPNANVHIYGAYLPQQITEKHNPKIGFFIQGWATNVHTVMQETKVNLAPLRFGAGIKGKLIDAMRNGLPSVTTTVGAEAMHNNMSWNGEIADDAVSFAEAAVRLYKNETLWSKAQENGVKINNSCYSRTRFEAELADKISTLQNHLESHRNSNFIGSMLLHHSMGSTKYLSKWIEEKEKNK